MNSTAITVTNVPQTYTFTIPAAAYSDGASQIKVKRVSGYTTLAKVSEIRIEDTSGKLAKTSDAEMEVKVLRNFILEQNYPNPFNPVTEISFEIPAANHVRLAVYDIQGKVVKLIVNEYKQAGHYSYSFERNNLSSGNYLYELISGDQRTVKKMMMLK